DEVGAERWPGSAQHPGTWGRPWKGILLAVDDPRAWEGSIAFAPGLPTRDEVRAHVARHPWLTEPGHDVPILWEFGKTYWQSAANVRPYAEDYAAWERERAEALREAERREAEWERAEAARRAERARAAAARRA